MTTDESTQEKDYPRAEPLSEALKFLFGPISVEQLTAEQRFMVVKQAIRVYGGKLAEVSQPFKEYLQSAQAGSTRWRLRDAKGVRLCTILSTEALEESLFISTLVYNRPEQEFFRCTLHYKNEEGPGGRPQKVVASYDANFLAEEDVRNILDRQPHLCVHILRSLRAASQVKLAYHAGEADAFSLIAEQIGDIASKLTF